jgi:hypothetical protein
LYYQNLFVYWQEMKLLKYVLQFTKLEDYFTTCLKFDEQKEQQIEITKRAADRDNKKTCLSDGWKSIFDQDVLNIHAKQAKSPSVWSLSFASFIHGI